MDEKILDEQQASASGIVVDIDLLGCDEDAILVKQWDHLITDRVDLFHGCVGDHDDERVLMADRAGFIRPGAGGVVAGPAADVLRTDLLNHRHGLFCGDILGVIVLVIDTDVKGVLGLGQGCGCAQQDGGDQRQ